MVEIKDSTEEDWEWAKDVDDDISESLIVFDPPLNLKQPMLHYVLEKLHKMGVKYDNHWGKGKGMPIMKHKTKVRFGKLSSLPIFYKNSEIHNTEGEIYSLGIDHNKILDINTDRPPNQLETEELSENGDYKIFNAYELFL